MALHLDDTAVEDNTDASVQSIFKGVRWLRLEEYKQSERLYLHRQVVTIFAHTLTYGGFTPAAAGAPHSGTQERGSSIPACMSFPAKRAPAALAAGKRLCAALSRARYEGCMVSFMDGVYGIPTKQANEGVVSHVYLRRGRRRLRTRRRGSQSPKAGFWGIRVVRVGSILREQMAVSCVLQNGDLNHIGVVSADRE